MDVDRSKLKALSSDTRLDILKTLRKRRFLPSELSRKLGLSPSTIVGHLQVLEHADLVVKEKTGHKWIYYRLSSDGEGIMRPTAPLRVLFTVLFGGGVLITSLFQLLSPQALFEKMSAPLSGQAADTLVETIQAPVSIVADDPLVNPFAMVGAAVGILFLALGWYFYRTR